MDFNLDETEIEKLRTFHLPVLQEFFNRVVDAYPRTSSGLLGSIRNENGTPEMQLEMVKLHNLALFPIHYQRHFSEEVALTQRFRNNVQLVIDTFMSRIHSEHARASLMPHMVCPSGDSAPERDLSVATNSQLWALQFIRLVGRVQCAQDLGYNFDDTEYDLNTIHWMCVDVMDLLSVEIQSGHNLIALVEALVTAVGV
ncbi:hypothetical protein VNI00_005519 [Paramarasmius palmivorus]|uniref:Uncharacterized protein n=1 Tax=Paramarasmius palmivorus TaxID=297713 RepID=A0AAW0DDK3_9AGAR